MLGEEPVGSGDKEEDPGGSIIDIAEHLPRAPRPQRRPRLPEHLEVIEEEIIPEEVKADPSAWRCIGREVSEQLDYIRARFVNRRQVRLKYVHRTERARPPVIAPLPARLADRSLPAPGLLAHVVVSKYADALPLYRQEQIYKQRHGVEISRQTMVRWVERVAYALQPVYRQMRADMLAGDHLQVDETPIRYLEVDNNNAENAIRPVAVGRKNFLFIEAEDAGWRSAILYSIIASCRRRGIEPMTYLTDVLARLPQATNHNLHKLTPANWAKEHRPQLQRAA